MALGLEEQHGPRRDTPSPANAFRQGAWGEFRRVATPLALSLRHEAWGDRAILRGGARVVTTVRLEASGPLGWKLAVTHSVFRSRRGESLYLAEGEIDRLVLRAVSGEGERSRIELRLPAAGGRITGGLQLVRSVGRAAPVRWSLDWSRRGRGMVAPTTSGPAAPEPPQCPRSTCPARIHRCAWLPSYFSPFL